MKIWILKLILFYWDVLFTLIDNWALKRFHNLKEHIRFLENEELYDEKQMYYDLQSEEEYNQLEKDWFNSESSNSLKSHTKEK